MLRSSSGPLLTIRTRGARPSRRPPRARATLGPRRGEPPAEARDAAALEVTLGGACCVVETCAVASPGPIPAWMRRRAALRSEAVHRIPPAPDRLAAGDRGARAYVALAADRRRADDGLGLVVPPDGWARTDARLAGDRLEPRRRGDLGAVGHAPPPVGSASAAAGGLLGVVPGPTASGAAGCPPRPVDAARRVSQPPTAWACASTGHRWARAPIVSHPRCRERSSCRPADRRSSCSSTGRRSAAIR